MWHDFQIDISSYPIPTEFDYPHQYQPHSLARIAALELQNYIQNQTDWKHNFGLGETVEGTEYGKMFGVLVVRNSAGKLGHLWAFSGKLSERSVLQNFVPPVFNLLDEQGFYRKGEEEINLVNRKINAIEQSTEFLSTQIELKELAANREVEIEFLSTQKKENKALRKVKREQLEQSLSGQELQKALEELSFQSQADHYAVKDCKKKWKQNEDALQAKLLPYQTQIQELKQKRKGMSAKLQNAIFDHYTFLNIKKEEKSIREIFKVDEFGLPPSGAGECAAPKLLHYAFQQNLTPICMAEFWWGKSPNTIIRKHQQFYPACKAKCKPILEHMLDGMKIGPNPVFRHQNQAGKIKDVYEDEHLLIIHKPHDFLSVIGRTTLPSVQEEMQKRFPESNSPLIVHRLDMSTSGIMLIPKTMEAYLNLQKQFADKSIRKRYIAILNGELNKTQGEIDLPLRVDLNNRPHQMVCYEHGKVAYTEWRTIWQNEGLTKVEFFPKTGRTHQLRIHAAHQLGLNTPILGDDLYGIPHERLFLQAQAIEFIHPVSGEKMKIEVEEEF